MCTIRIGALLAFAFVGAGLAAFAQTTRMPPLSSVPERSFVETIARSTNVTGAAVVGLVDVRLEDPTPNSKATITVSGIDPKGGSICVSVESINGLYRAEFVVPNPKLGRTVAFQTPSVNMPKGSTILGGLAVTARQSAGKQCASDTPLLLVAWGRVRPASEIYVAVNARQARVVRISSANADASTCDPIRDYPATAQSSPVAYDRFCRVRIDLPCGAENILMITSRDEIRARDPVKLVIKGRCE